MRIHRHLNDGSTTGKKIILLLRACQGDDLREDEIERARFDVSTLEEAGLLLWERIFHSPDPDSSRAREPQYHEADRLQRLRAHSPFKDYSSDDTSSEDNVPGSLDGLYENSGTSLKHHRQNVNKRKLLADGIPRRPKGSSGYTSLPGFVSGIAVASSAVYQTPLELLGLPSPIPGPPLRCTDPKCARYRRKYNCYSSRIARVLYSYFFT